MKVVGLTGGIATGKSTVGRLFAQWGAAVIDADHVARAVLEPGTPGFREVREAFGPEAVGPDGRVDRPWLRRRIAHDPEAKRTLDRITHPRIAAEIAGQLAKLAADGVDLAFVEAALMVETGSYRMYPELVVVTTTPALQRHRLLQRDGSTVADADALIATQLPLADKERVATWVVHNDQDIDHLRREARAVFERIRGPAPA